MNRLVHYLVINYHLTRSETRVVVISVYLLTAVIISVAILAVRKGLRRSLPVDRPLGGGQSGVAPPPQSVRAVRVCSACGAPSEGASFCPECGHKRS